MSAIQTLFLEVYLFRDVLDTPLFRDVCYSNMPGRAYPFEREETSR